jgi:uncharacterized Fe-S cluster protein YjdI
MGQSGRKTYSNGEVTVIWEPARCIHSEKCFHGLPAVFDPGRRPWIDVKAADSAAIAAQVRACPSGALSLGEAPAAAPAPEAPTAFVAPVEPVANGPLLIGCAVRLRLADGSEKHCPAPVALCRCGASANKPFCDGSHTRIGFQG